MQVTQSIERVKYHQDVPSLADAHCHLDLFDDPATVVNEAISKGVSVIITSGGSRKGNEMTSNLAKGLNVYGVIGIDPTFAAVDHEYVEQSIDLIKKNVHLIGIGEIGLDAKVEDKAKPDIQKEVFMAQIDIANDLGIPVVVHSRGRMKEVIKIFDEHPADRAMFHFFEGDEDQARYLAKRGHMISIPPRESARMKRVIKEIDLTHIVAETDAPVAGKAPSDVRSVVELISSIKNIDFSEAAERVSDNVKGFFHI